MSARTPREVCLGLDVGGEVRCICAILWLLFIPQAQVACCTSCCMRIFTSNDFTTLILVHFSTAQYHTKTHENYTDMRRED